MTPSVIPSARAHDTPKGTVRRRRLVGYAYQALVSPARPAEQNTLLRALLRRPRVFDLVSLVLQARDLGRLGRITAAYAMDDEHARRAHDYNAGVSVSKLITTTRRAEGLYRIAALPPRNLSGEQLLSVGP